ncbi:MAG: family 2 glycosyl transferase [Microgenomates group bacterium LiPW_16]|nr:MAG: family 2 glycosyl transferase [Microgenomates group bacterium LiPW_16]
MENLERRTIPKSPEKSIPREVFKDSPPENHRLIPPHNNPEKRPILKQEFQIPEPLLTVIVVNYNTGEFLRGCLKSLYQAEGNFDFDIYVVDNASTDNTLDIVESEFPDINLWLNKENVGFASANNLVLRECQSKYFLLLNPDTVTSPDAIKKMVEFMESHPEAAAVGPKLVYEDGTVDWRCRRGFPTPQAIFYQSVGLASLFPKNEKFTAYTLSHLAPDKTTETGTISGSCMMIRKEVVDQVGDLDEDYFLGFEDIDWCYRVKKSLNPKTGEPWKIYFNPEAKVLHLGGRSKTQRKIRSSLELYKSMRLFYQKHFRPNQPKIQQLTTEACIGISWGIQTVKTLLSHQR